MVHNLDTSEKIFIEQYLNLAFAFFKINKIKSLFRTQLNIYDRAFLPV